MAQTQPTRTVFCAKCQQDTPHAVSVNINNGEFIFSCKNVIVPAITDDKGNVTTPAVVCDRFIKLPPDATPVSATTYFTDHKEQNEGQVSLEEQEKKLETLLGDIADTPVQSEEETSA